jgi:hypothetical protein
MCMIQRDIEDVIVSNLKTEIIDRTLATPRREVANPGFSVLVS